MQTMPRVCVLFFGSDKGSLHCPVMLCIPYLALLTPLQLQPVAGDVLAFITEGHDSSSSGLAGLCLFSVILKYDEMFPLHYTSPFEHRLHS